MGLQLVGSLQLSQGFVIYPLLWNISVYNLDDFDGTLGIIINNINISF